MDEPRFQQEQPGSALGAVGPLRITDEDIAESGPAVRALLVARLEQLWKPVEMRLDMEKDGSMPMDPRMMEIGVRICKELAGHYRLARPPLATPEEDTDLLGPGVDRAALVEQKLSEIEARIRSQPDHQR